MVDTFNIEDYKDLKVITIDKTKPIEERLRQYIMDVKNPYMVRVGDTQVKIEFAGGRSFSDALTAVFGA